MPQEKVNDDGIFRNQTREQQITTFAIDLNGNKCNPENAWAYKTIRGQGIQTNYFIKVNDNLPKHKQAGNLTSLSERFKNVSKEVFVEYVEYLETNSNVCYNRAKTAYELGGFI